MGDWQPKLFLLRVAVLAAFFVQVVFSQSSNATSIEILVSNINVSTVEVRFDNNDTKVPVQVDFDNTTNSLKIHSLHPGTLYNITAADSSGVFQTWSLSTRPLEPTDVTENVTGTTVSISWKFDEQKSGGSEWLIHYKTESETAYTNMSSALKIIQLTLPEDGAKYEVKIWTVFNNMKSEESLNTSFVTDPNALSDATVKPNGRNITVSWKNRKTSFTYTVCLKATSNCIGKISTDTHTFTNQVAGKSYTVSIIVHAYDRNSTEYTETVNLPPLPPNIEPADNIKTDSAVINWNLNSSLSLGDQWFIQYKTGSNPYENGTTTHKHFDLNNLVDGEMYEVKIWTISNNEYSKSYSSINFSTYPKPLSKAEVNPTGTKITVKWTRRKPFTYTVCLTNTNKCHANQSVNTVTFTDLLPGTKYNVSIVVNAHGKNSNPYYKSEVLPPLSPNIQPADNIKTNSAVIKWNLDNSSSLGNEWLIEYKTSSKTYQNVTQSNKQIELTPLEDGEIYEVKIWTRSNKVYSKSYSKITFITYPKSVSNVKMDTKERNIEIIWDQRKQFSYTVCLTNIPNCTEKTKTNTHTFTNLIAGKLYNASIIVHAHGKSSEEYTDAVILPPLPPTTVTKNLTNNELFMEWYIDSNISVASEWRIEYMTENSTDEKNTSIRNITLQLEGGKEYVIKIWSKSLGVESDTYSNITVKTAPEEVLNITVEEVKHELKLSWSPPLQSLITNYSVGYSESCSKNQQCSSCSAGKTNTRSSRYNIVDKVISTETTSFTFETKPGCCYSITIWAFNVIKGKPAYFECRTASFEPPVENKPEDMTFGSPSINSIIMTLKRNPFTEIKGPIINYNIIVAIHKDKQYTTEKYLPNWSKFKNDGNIKAYQIFKNCSNLYEKSNACSNLKSKSKRSLGPVQYKIGTESCENDTAYCNGPLDPDTNYYIKVRAYTFDKFSDTEYASFRTEKEKMEAYLIAIIVLIVLLIIAVIIAIVLYMVRRKRAKPKSVVSNDSLYLMQPTSHPVRAADFETHFALMSADTDYRFAEEYESLKDVGKHNQTVAAHLSNNRIKNRFVNILPYDFSRVKLSKSVDDEDEGSDYINANYIPGFTSRREYIATQGPLSSTRDDFWRMVWEQNVHNIVMLANCIEKHREKCDHYWPDSEETRCYGNIKVEKLNETITADWTITEFLMSNHDRVTRHLHHFHFTSWPDFGVPSSPQSLVMFVRLVRQKLQNVGPLVIHCSAGVGRTGTFISVDHSLQDLERFNEVDVLRVVHEMRQYRSFMVQTEEQYIFIHRCILHALRGDIKEDIYENDTYVNEDIYQNMNAGQVNKAFLYEDEGIHVDSP